VFIDDLVLEAVPEAREFSGIPAIGWCDADGMGIKSHEGIRGDVRFERPTALGGLIVRGRSLEGVEVHTKIGGAEAEGDGPIIVRSDRSRGIMAVPMPDALADVIEVRAIGDADARITNIAVQPLAFGDSTNGTLATLATVLPRGAMPRYFGDGALAVGAQQTYWTVIGADGDRNEALVGEDGSVEVVKGGFSLEPFVTLENAAALTWANTEIEQTLAEGYLPIPTVTRRGSEGMVLETTAFVDGEAGASNLAIKYALTNSSASIQSGTLWIAARPLQVNPPTQALNMVGGAARIEAISISGTTMRVDGRPVVMSRPTPARPFRAIATTFDSGEIGEVLVGDGASGIEQQATAMAVDPRGLASGALGFDFSLVEGESLVVGVVTPMHMEFRASSELAPESITAEEIDARLAAATKTWRERLGGVTLDLPGEHGRLISESVKANLASILINRDGPAIQPGSRSYERSWIRDGALTSSALLAFGFEREVMEFLDWYGPYQYDNGKIPCVVDHRGPDPVPEYDSHGEYIYAVRKCFMHTGDTAFLARHWPRVIKAVEYIEFLRAQRMTAEFRDGPDERSVFYGLVPESISHEGYSAKPMHSYWDNAWCVKGVLDAWALAEIVGDSARASAYRTMHAEYEKATAESIARAMRIKTIDYVPGCAELGDFDATSTTVFLWPCGFKDVLPRAAVTRTFAKFHEYFTGRADGTIEWKDYTPYELRQVGSWVLLGNRERAHEMLAWYFKDQRPAGFRHWAEVVRKGNRTPGFIGDMPHTWCGSDFINSVRLMLAWTRDSDGRLVLGMGVPREWLESQEGMKVAGLQTEFGAVGFSSTFVDGTVRISIETVEQTPLGVHPGGGGLAWSLPEVTNIESVTVNGEDATPDTDGHVLVPSVPAIIEVTYRK
jgi:hypothetical protein